MTPGQAAHAVGVTYATAKRCVRPLGRSDQAELGEGSASI